MSKNSKIAVGIIVGVVVCIALAIGVVCYMQYQEAKTFNEQVDTAYAEMVEAIPAADLTAAEDPHGAAVQELIDIIALEGSLADAEGVLTYHDGSTNKYDEYTQMITDRKTEIVSFIRGWYDEQAAPYMDVDVANTDRDTLASYVEALTNLRAVIEADQANFAPAYPIWGDEAAYTEHVANIQTNLDAEQAQVDELDRIAAEEAAAQAAASNGGGSGSGGSGSYSGGSSGSNGGTGFKDGAYDIRYNENGGYWTYRTPELDAEMERLKQESNNKFGTNI